MLTIVASMEQEIASLRRDLRRRATWAGGMPDVTVIGVGEERVVEASRMLMGLSLHPPGRPFPLPEKLLMVGFTGGLDPTLAAGQLVLSSRYYLAAGAMSKQEPAGILVAGGREDFLSPDPDLWRQAVEAAADAGVPSVKVDSLTVSRLVTSPQAKRALGQLYPAGVVNMEDYWVARTARKAGVPFLSARVVLDTADQALPGYLLGLSGSRTRAVLSIAALPWRIPAVLSLARRVPPAQRVLAKFALAFLERLNRGEAEERRLLTSTSGHLSRSARNVST